MTCDEFNKSVRLIANGMTEQDVIKQLGAPREKKGDVWFYYGYKGERAPRVGEQYFSNAQLIFENGRVKAINHSWVDATGSQE